MKVNSFKNFEILREKHTVRKKRDGERQEDRSIQMGREIEKRQTEKTARDRETKVGFEIYSWLARCVWYWVVPGRSH